MLVRAHDLNCKKFKEWMDGYHGWPYLKVPSPQYFPFPQNRVHVLNLLPTEHEKIVKVCIYEHFPHISVLLLNTTVRDI